MPRKTKEEIELEKDKARRKALRSGPDLDQFMNGKKRRYTTYVQGAVMYSMNYYTFVSLVKEAGANIRIRKKVVVDLDVLDVFMERVENGGDTDE